MKIELSLIAKDVKVIKICTSEIEAYKFERDMPARYHLLFSGKPYAIGRKVLD